MSSRSPDSGGEDRRFLEKDRFPSSITVTAKGRPTNHKPPSEPGTGPRQISVSRSGRPDETAAGLFLEIKCLFSRRCDAGWTFCETQNFSQTKDEPTMRFSPYICKEMNTLWYYTVYCNWANMCKHVNEFLLGNSSMCCTSVGWRRWKMSSAIHGWNKTSKKHENVAEFNYKVQP